MNFIDRLEKQILFFDGAMGSMLQSANIPLTKLPEQLNVDNPEIIIDIHKKYLQAGADIITTNTFGAYSLKYTNTAEIIAAAVKNAKSAIREVNMTDKYVALDMGPTGKLLKPLGELSFEECYDIFKESAKAGEENGADLIIIETISDTYEAKAAVLAAKENTTLPVICTMTFDENGKALTGADILTMTALLEGLCTDCIGINCGLGPVQIKQLFDELVKYSSVPILVQPNAGLPTVVDGKTSYNIDPIEFASLMLPFAESGAAMLGGCCGTTPSHIKEMTALCRNIQRTPVTNKDLTVVSSYSRSVILSDKPVIIGERINPTGKKKFKDALKNNDLNYVLNEAFSQKDNGADILDVNVGLPEIDEQKLMLESILAIQGAIDLPLQIDSSTPDVIEKALRIYNGKPMINSVNGKTSVMEKIFPMVKKYGGVVVGLTLDEKGIPSTAEGRLQIAERIVKKASEYGIDKKDIVIDTLTLTVSAQQTEAMETIKALRLVKETLGVKTVLGVSNISFGLPERQLINKSFLTLALYEGLGACIINPASSPMIDAINAYNVIAAIDKGSAEYIKKYSDSRTVSSESPSSQLNLKDFIIKGIKSKGYDETNILLRTKAPLEVVNDYIIPALDTVGNGYETGIIFLPQLIMSAEAAKDCFRAIEEHIRQLGETPESKGTIAIATVEGDIHDIGKNIVKALLENYGFEIIDLGKDVPVKTVVDAVKEHGLKLVGLSALMTTTVVNMEKTIKEIRLAAPDCRIMVGGAVLNEEYAKTIGADFYGKDALASVSFAQKIFV